MNIVSPNFQSNSPGFTKSTPNKSKLSKKENQTKFTPFTPETPYTPLKETKLPHAYKKIRPVKWTGNIKNPLEDEIEEPSITSDKLASIILASSKAKETKRKTKVGFN